MSNLDCEECYTCPGCCLATEHQWMFTDAELLQAYTNRSELRYELSALKETLGYLASRHAHVDSLLRAVSNINSVNNGVPFSHTEIGKLRVRVKRVIPLGECSDSVVVYRKKPSDTMWNLEKMTLRGEATSLGRVRGKKNAIKKAEVALL